MTAARLVTLLPWIAVVAACTDARSPLPTGPDPAPTPPTRLLQILPLAGADQRGVAGDRLATAIQIEVRDDAGTIAAGVRVSFTTIGGSASTLSQTTDAAGRAATEWTLGWTPGRQFLRANVDSGGVSAALTIHADADVNPIADLIIARGGAASTVHLMFIADFTVRQNLQLAGADTIVYMAPDSDLSDHWIAAFAVGRSPAVVRPRSSPGTDTTALVLGPPLDVPVTVWLADSTPNVRAAAERDLQTTDTFWRMNPWGLRIGDVRFQDVSQQNLTISCQYAPGGDHDRINIFYSTLAQIAGFGGYSCSPRTIIMRSLSGAAAYLLAHEIGHSFGLGHPPAHVTGNFMHSSAMSGGVLLWQIFTAHFGSFSALNSVYGFRTLSERQACCIVPFW